MRSTASRAPRGSAASSSRSRSTSCPPSRDPSRAGSSTSARCWCSTPTTSSCTSRYATLVVCLAVRLPQSMLPSLLVCSAVHRGLPDAISMLCCASREEPLQESGVCTKALSVFLTRMRSESLVYLGCAVMCCDVLCCAVHCGRSGACRRRGGAPRLCQCTSLRRNRTPWCARTASGSWRREGARSSGPTLWTLPCLPRCPSESSWTGGKTRRHFGPWACLLGICNVMSG